MSRQHLSWGHLSISAISQLILARFGSNFKQRVLGTYTTDYNCHYAICPDNICPMDICPYQQYIICYWPNLDQTLNKGSWEHKQQITTVTTTFVQATFVLGTFVQISNISISKLNTFDLSLVTNYNMWTKQNLIYEKCKEQYMNRNQYEMEFQIQLASFNHLLAIVDIQSFSLVLLLWRESNIW